MSVYRVTELIGTSSESWEDAATSAFKVAQKSLRDLRVAQVVNMDMTTDDEGEFVFRTKLALSFRYEESQ